MTVYRCVCKWHHYGYVLHTMSLQTPWCCTHGSEQRPTTGRAWWRSGIFYSLHMLRRELGCTRSPCRKDDCGPEPGPLKWLMADSLHGNARCRNAVKMLRKMSFSSSALISVQMWNVVLLIWTQTWCLFKHDLKRETQKLLNRVITGDMFPVVCNLKFIYELVIFL